ncbi:MAG: NACHT domain-containing protein, partial [Parachlamydiaceae bacterium]
MDPSTLQCTHSRQPEYRQLYDLAEQNGPVTVNAQSTHLDAGAKQKIIVLNNNISAFLFLGQRITLLQQIANQGCSDCAVDLKQQAVVWLKDSEKRLAEKAILYLVTAYKTQKTYNNNTTEIKEKLSEVFNSCSCHKGNNLLHHFIEYEYFPVIDYLFDVEKEIVNDWLKEQNEEGNTPLHLAVQQALKSKKDRQKFESVIKKLLDCKANPEVKNSEGKTPLDLASKEVKAIFFTSEQFCLHHVKNQITCFYASRDREIKRSFWVYAPPLKIEECFINLSILKEGKQKDKEKEALEKKSKREQIFGSYEDVFKTADKKPIHLKDLFESRDGKDPKKLLILGRAGIGKSTLCQYLTHLWWGNDGVWKNQFDLVVRINLRNLTRKRYRNENVSFEKVIVRECFQSTNQEEKEIQYIEKALASIPGERKLFLLDGYDEFPADSPCKTAINTLLSSQNGSYLIVTSRPYASIRSVDFDCCLECIGFTSEDIPEYLNLPGVCKDDDAKEKILAFFKQNPAIHNLAHIPILLDLFTLSSEKILALKSVTMTKLYKHIVSKIWEKYNSTQAELNPKQREKGANPKLKKAKKFLKALAFYSFLESGIVFSYDSVEKAAKTTCRWDEDQIAGQVESLMTPGFLNCYRGKTLAENQYSFPHLTIQEYFAAFYITDWLSTDRKIQVYNQNTGKREKITAWQFILKNRYNPRFQIVWHFMSGILADSNSDYLQHFFNCLLQEPKDIIGSYHTCLLIRCLEEAGIPDLENASVFTQLKESCEILMRRRDLALLDALKLSSKMVIKLEIIEWIVSILNLKNEFFGGSDEDLSIEPPNESLQNINYQAFLNAFLFFKKLVKIGHSFPEEKSIRILIDCLSESDEWINFDAVRALRAIIQSSPDLSNQIFAKLLKLCENRKTVSAAIYAIGEIGKSGQISLEAMSTVIGGLYLENKLFKSTASQALGKILTTGCSITDEAVSQLAKDIKIPDSEYVRANIASALGLIAVNKSSQSQEILTSLSEAIKDRSDTVRSKVVEVLSCIVQQQGAVAESAMAILLTTMQEEKNKHVQWVIFREIGRIIAKNTSLTQK